MDIYMCVIKHIMPWENRHGLIRSKWTRQSILLKQPINLSFCPKSRFWLGAMREIESETPHVVFSSAFERHDLLVSPLQILLDVGSCDVWEPPSQLMYFGGFFFPSSILWRVFSLFYWHVCLAYKMYITIQYSCGKWHT
jgi:hypothetical protein